jgi:hypothetical protein
MNDPTNDIMLRYTVLSLFVGTVILLLIMYTILR